MSTIFAPNSVFFTFNFNSRGSDCFVYSPICASYMTLKFQSFVCVRVRVCVVVIYMVIFKKL